MTTDKPYWEQDIAECLRVAAEIIGPNSYYLRAAEYIEEIRSTLELHIAERDRLKALNAELVDALHSIAAFAPGNGDVCEVIAKKARAALAKCKEEA